MLHALCILAIARLTLNKHAWKTCCWTLTTVNGQTCKSSRREQRTFVVDVLKASHALVPRNIGPSGIFPFVSRFEAYIALMNSVHYSLRATNQFRTWLRDIHQLSPRLIHHPHQAVIYKNAPNNNIVHQTKVHVPRKHEKVLLLKGWIETTAESLCLHILFFFTLLLINWSMRLLVDRFVMGTMLVSRTRIASSY